MSGDLTPALPKIARLLPRLASDADGEIVATARAIGRTLRGAGFDWHDLVAALAPAPKIAVVTYREPSRSPTGWTPPPAPGAFTPRTMLQMAESVAWHGAVPLPASDVTFCLRLVRQLRSGVPANAKQEARLRALFTQLGGAR